MDLYVTKIIEALGLDADGQPPIEIYLFDGGTKISVILNAGAELTKRFAVTAQFQPNWDAEVIGGLREWLADQRGRKNG